MTIGLFSAKHRQEPANVLRCGNRKLHVRSGVGQAARSALRGARSADQRSPVLQVSEMKGQQMNCSFLQHKDRSQIQGPRPAVLPRRQRERSAGRRMDRAFGRGDAFVHEFRKLIVFITRIWTTACFFRCAASSTSAWTESTRSGRE